MKDFLVYYFCFMKATQEKNETKSKLIQDDRNREQKSLNMNGIYDKLETLTRHKQTKPMPKKTCLIMSPNVFSVLSLALSVSLSSAKYTLSFNFSGVVTWIVVSSMRMGDESKICKSLMLFLIKKESKRNNSET